MTNPNGANQYKTDPRQKLCWDLYVKPSSETFGNAYQSAQKAGYEESYAAQITVAPWFLEKLRKLNMLTKAEKALNDTLEYNPVNEEGKVDSSVARVRLDAAKFVAERLGKEDYSSRTELTSKDGEDLPQPILYVLNNNQPKENSQPNQED